MESNCIATIRVTNRGTEQPFSTAFYIEDDASGEILFQAVIPQTEWLSVLAGQSITVRAHTTPFPERIGHELEVETYTVPTNIIDSARNHEVDLAKASLEWFARQPDFDTVDEVEVGIVTTDNVSEWVVTARRWDGLELEDEEDGLPS